MCKPGDAKVTICSAPPLCHLNPTLYQINTAPLPRAACIKALLIAGTGNMPHARVNPPKETHSLLSQHDMAGTSSM